MTSDFILYGSPHAQFTYKVALMLRVSGQPFAFRYVSFQKEMHRTPEFLALSRWGQVPVLVHQECRLTQSGAILEYLADVLGSFRGSQQDVREWLFWDADRLSQPVYGCYGVCLGELKLLPIIVDPVIAAHYRAGLQAALAELDEQLAPNDFLIGTEPNIADLACQGDVAFAEMSGFEIERWKYIAGWAARLSKLPGFALPLDLLPMADALIDMSG